MTPLRSQRDLVAQPTLGATRPAEEATSHIVDRSAPPSVDSLDLRPIPDPQPAAALADDLKRMKAGQRYFGMGSDLHFRRHSCLPFHIRSQIDSGAGGRSRVVFRALWVTACPATTSRVAARG